MHCPRAHSHFFTQCAYMAATRTTVCCVSELRAEINEETLQFQTEKTKKQMESIAL